jgi:hypothetical protein
MTDNNTPRFTLGKKIFLPGIIWFLVVLILICLPGEDIPKNDWLDTINFDKIVHAGLFGGIVFWFCMPFKKSAFTKEDKVQWFLKITIATCLWGLTTELIQLYFIHNRQFDLLDWAADSLGAILAYFLCKRIFL